jgi:hypothetical protein
MMNGLIQIARLKNQISWWELIFGIRFHSTISQINNNKGRILTIEPANNEVSQFDKAWLYVIKG